MNKHKYFVKLICKSLKLSTVRKLVRKEYVLFFLYSVERDINGNLLDDAKCEACNGESPALSVPNNSGDRYVISLGFTCQKCRLKCLMFNILDIV